MRLLWMVLAVLLCAAQAQANTQWNPLLERLASDGFDRNALSSIFNRQTVDLDKSIMGRKIRTLYLRKFGSRDVKQAQWALYKLGFKPGPADGKAGTKTVKAVMGYQKAHGLKVDGRISMQLLTHIQTRGRKAPKGYSPPSLPPKPKQPAVYACAREEATLNKAEQFYYAHRRTLQSVKKAYGVPPEIAIGILAVETSFGTYLGNRSALQALASMAACNTYESVAVYLRDEHPGAVQKKWADERCRGKADWAYNELKALLAYSDLLDREAHKLPGSIYGAIGISQFMPSNALAYGVDGNGDGLVDLFCVSDALHSMGNFLREHGWRRSISRKGQRKVLFRYNRSTRYVNSILAVADHVRSALEGDVAAVRSAN